MTSDLASSKTVTKYTPISGMREVLEAPVTYTFVHWDDYERLQRELRLAESARDYANDLLDRARQRSAVETTPARAYGPGMTPHADDCECYVCTRSRIAEQAGSNDALRSFEIIWSLISEQFPYWAVANAMHADNVRSALELSPEELQRAVHVLARQSSAVEPTLRLAVKDESVLTDAGKAATKDGVLDVGAVKATEQCRHHQPIAEWCGDCWAAGDVDEEKKRASLNGKPEHE